MERESDRVLGQHSSPCRRMSVKVLGTGIIILFGMFLQPVNTAYSKRSEKFIKAPVIRQFPELPTGCEAASTAMLLKWAGVNVGKEQIAQALPKGSIPVRKKNSLYGANPNRVFVGNPFSRNGYGVYHRPVAAVIDRYLPGRARDMTGASFNEVLKVISSNKPVIVWCTIGNIHPKVSKIWYDSAGSKIIWRTPEHAVLLVGYDASHVIVNDPWKGKICRYPMSSFKEHWEIMGRQAVTIK